MRHWTLDDIPWDRFDPTKVDPETLRIVKAASMVEHNGGDYATYLCNVFPDDSDFQAAAKAWGMEEVQHGRALGRWAQMAEPDFDFDSSFERFLRGFRLPLEAVESVRGSRSGELVARCIVEVGTSSFYAALGEATEEPVLREICRQVAADELRHYKLFYTHLKRYLAKENIGKWRRMMIAAGRIGETEDDELAYAYYAANGDPLTPYDRKRWSKAYMQRAYAIYKKRHVERATVMTMKAAGFNPQGRPARWASNLAYLFMRTRSQLAASASA